MFATFGPSIAAPTASIKSALPPDSPPSWTGCHCWLVQVVQQGICAETGDESSLTRHEKVRRGFLPFL